MPDPRHIGQPRRQEDAALAKAGLTGIVRALRRRLVTMRPATVGLLAALITILAIGLAAASFLARDRSEVLRQSADELDTISSAAAGFMARALGTLDVVVSLGLDEFASGKLDRKALSVWMAGHAPSAGQQLDALADHVITDAAGTIVAGTVASSAGLSVADRAYFQMQRDVGGPWMFVGAPIMSRTLPTRRLVPISWALRDQDGRFGGVIALATDWGLYADMFSRLLTRPDQVIMLLDGEGRLYALDSRHWPDTDQEPRAPAFLNELTGQPVPDSGYAIADDTMAAQAVVGGSGLHLFTAAPLGTVLREWWVRCYIAAGITLAVSLGAGLLTGLLHRHVQALRSAAVEARGAQRRAEAGDRAKAQFLAAMSHEIRTPMTGVLGMADLLASENLEPRHRAYVQSIRTSGRHLLSVINDILDFSRASAGGLVLEHVDFQTTQLLEQARSIMAPQARDRGLRLEFQADPGVPEVLRGDPTRLRQILVNLIGNGLKFSSQGGVTVRQSCAPLADEQYSCRFEVHDTGIGIPAERQAELFQAFTQADLSTTRKYGGSGLGLAICRQLVEAMGGRIGVESEPGRGSCFWFEVPLEEGAAPVAEAAAEAVAKARPLRILLAEDVEINRDLLQATLGRDGHCLVMVENGQEAVAAATAEQFDAVLMDVQMPVMDGIEATRRIRALPSPLGRVPIMALTANVMDTERQRCLQAGMNRVLTKPIVWSELQHALGELCATGPAEASPPEPSSGSATPPAGLLDRARIDGLGDIAGPARLAEFLRSAIISAEGLFSEMVALRGDPAETARIAHRLAGTAPSFGLALVGTLAREIELRALEDGRIDEPVAELRAALAATRCELERCGLLPRT